MLHKWLDSKTIYAYMAFQNLLQTQILFLRIYTIYQYVAEEGSV